MSNDKLRDDIMSAEGLDNLINEETTALGFLKALRQALNEPNALDSTDENGAYLLVDVINAASTDLLRSLIACDTPAAAKTLRWRLGSLSLAVRMVR